MVDTLNFVLASTLLALTAMTGIALLTPMSLDAACHEAPAVVARGERVRWLTP
jgi:hypothetical protein